MTIAGKRIPAPYGQVPKSVRAWHCGSVPDDRAFTDYLQHLRRGEGMGILGPGIYFITDEGGARVYCKYAAEPRLYEAVIDTSAFYDSVWGEPRELQERVRQAALDVGVRNPDGDVLQSLRWGRHTIGLMHKHAGAARTVESLIRHGVRGAIERLGVDNGRDVWELAVFDPSTIHHVRSADPREVSMLTPNGTADRLRYIAKTYSSKPLIVLDTISVIALTVGEDNWTSKIREAAKADPEFWKDAQRYGVHGRYGMWGVDSQNPPAEYVTALVAMVSELPGFSRAHPADPLFPWVATQLAKEAKEVARKPRGSSLNMDDYQELLVDLRAKGTLLANWFVATRPDLTKTSASDALDLAEAWSEEREREEAEAAKLSQTQGEIVYKFKDGYTIQKLTTKPQLDAEGDVMQHCVGGYCDAVKHGRAVIYSLRDTKGRPHVTIEYDPDSKFVKQIKGKQNDEPAPKYKAYVDEFVATLPKMAAHIQEIYDYLIAHTEVEEEYAADTAKEWDAEGFTVGDVKEWHDIGVSNASDAARYNSEDVTPAEMTTWPEPVRRELWELDGGGNSERFDWLIAIGRLYAKIAELEPQQEKPDPNQLALPGGHFFAHEDRKRRPRTKRPKRAWGGGEDWDWDLGHHWRGTVEAAEIRKRLDEAEDWYEDDFDHESFEPWFLAGFTPAQARRWTEDVQAEPETAIALRKQRVSPQMVEDAIRHDRLDPDNVDNVDAVLRAVGIERNTKKTSRRAR